MKPGKLCAIAILSGLLLAGCGGDDDDDNPTFNPDRSLAQGVYDGTITYQDGGVATFNQLTIVLETGGFFIIYGETINNVFFVDGTLNGTGQILLNTNEFQSFDLNDYFFDRDTNGLGAVFNGTLVANFSSGNFFNGTANQTDSFVEFAGTVPAITVYNYNVAANPASIAGNWTMRDLLGSSLNLSVDTAGNFTGIYASGCSLSGTLTPRASGKNVFDMTISFGPTPCTQPSRTFSGVAIDYAPSMLARALVMSGTTTDRAEGTALYGTR